MKPVEGNRKRNMKMVSLILQGHSKAKAYAISRDKPNMSPGGASSGAAVQMQKVEVQVLLRDARERMMEKYANDVERAYDKQWEIAQKPTTPPNVAMAFYSSLQDRVIPKMPDLSLHKHVHDHRFPEFMKSKADIMALLEEPESAETIAKRNTR